MALDWRKFGKLVQRVIKFRAGVSKTPIKADSWEELIWAVMVTIYGQDQVKWDPQSHRKGVDLTAKINGETIRISAKATEIKRGHLSLSSYRLTRYGQLQEMLDFIREQHTKQIDVYLVCARQEVDKGVRYVVFKIKPNNLAPEPLLMGSNWTKTKDGFVLRDDIVKKVGFSCRIVSKMSNQLWYDIPVHALFLQQVVDIVIPEADLGQGLLHCLKELVHT
jgi:hypothetical protein